MDALLSGYVVAGTNYSNKLGSVTTKNFYSTSCTPSIHPEYVTGVSDAESSFFITFIESSKYSLGYTIQLGFQISLHKRDKALLELIKSYFGVGTIQVKNTRELTVYQVSSIKDLIAIVSHFDKYPLITQKRADYELFKLAFDMVSRKEHLKTEGFMRILSFKASLNKGLSSQLNNAFPGITPYLRPVVPIEPIKSPQWVSGFTEGDGNFSIIVAKSNTIKSGVQIVLRYTITQHTKDSVLINSFCDFFGCGKFSVRSNKGVCDYYVRSISDICQIIIPFFERYPLFGVKAKSYANFKEVAEIIKVKGHLSHSGLEEIRRIVAKEE